MIIKPILTENWKARRSRVYSGVNALAVEQGNKWPGPFGGHVAMGGRVSLLDGAVTYDPLTIEPVNQLGGSRAKIGRQGGQQLRQRTAAVTMGQKIGKPPLETRKAKRIAKILARHEAHRIGTGQHRER
jgi:hypothetical protein